jgi:hypothetical protein
MQIFIGKPKMMTSLRETRYKWKDTIKKGNEMVRGCELDSSGFGTGVVAFLLFSGNTANEGQIRFDFPRQ